MKCPRGPWGLTISVNSVALSFTVFPDLLTQTQPSSPGRARAPRGRTRRRLRALQLCKRTSVGLSGFAGTRMLEQKHPRQVPRLWRDSEFPFRVPLSYPREKVWVRMSKSLFTYYLSEYLWAPTQKGIHLSYNVLF